jgi:hypothetical protein
MVSLAGRGWPYILARYQGDGGPHAIIAIVGGYDEGTIITGEADGRVRWWNNQGQQTGELKTELEHVSGIDRAPDGSLVVTGMHGLLVVDAKHQVTRTIKWDHEPWFARRGPGADEISIINHEGLFVIDLDGKERRKVLIERANDMSEMMFDTTANHALYTANYELHVVDMTTMKNRVAAKEVRYELESAFNGSRFAYLDKDSKVHLVRGDGTDVKVIEGEARPSGIALSDDGLRLGISTEEELFTYDENGAFLNEAVVKYEPGLTLLHGNEAWITGREGTVRHFVDGQLVASVPAHGAEVRISAVARGVVATVGSDSTLIFTRSDARQATEDVEICKRIQFGQQGIATQYTCDDNQYIYSGRKKLGEYPLSSGAFVEVAYEPAYDRTALSADLGIRVFDGQGKQIGTTEALGTPDKYMGIAWADRDHLWVVEDRSKLAKWAFATNTWDKNVVTIPEATAIGSLPGALLVATAQGDLHVYVNNKETAKVAIGTPIIGISVSPDHKWVAAQLATGAAAIVDATSWTMTRVLAQGDANGDFPMFDETGDLILRADHYNLTIWDRASGEELVSGLDLLADLGAGRWLPDGRIETNRRRPGIVDIPRDNRPVAAILADIACHVPLKVVGSRIEPTVPIACAPGVSGRTLPR